MGHAVLSQHQAFNGRSPEGAHAIVGVGQSQSGRQSCEPRRKPQQRLACCGNGVCHCLVEEPRPEHHVGLVLDPGLTQDVAFRLGIGRGVDLMFYFFIIFSLFHFATTAATIRRLQRAVTELTQSLALLSPISPTESRKDTRNRT